MGWNHNKTGSSEAGIALENDLREKIGRPLGGGTFLFVCLRKQKVFRIACKARNVIRNFTHFNGGG